MHTKTMLCSLSSFIINLLENFHIFSKHEEKVKIERTIVDICKKDIPEILKLFSFNESKIKLELRYNIFPTIYNYTNYHINNYYRRNEGSIFAGEYPKSEIFKYILEILCSRFYLSWQPYGLKPTDLGYDKQLFIRAILKYCSIHKILDEKDILSYYIYSELYLTDAFKQNLLKEKPWL